MDHTQTVARGRDAWRARTLAGLLAMALVVAASVTAVGAQGPSAARGGGMVEEDPVFVTRDCWWPIPSSVPSHTTITCGTVEVPADRDHPGQGHGLAKGREGDTISLAVVRIHRAGADPDAPPTVYLHGGHGGDVLTQAPAGLATNRTLVERDIIAFDQRGVGMTTPSLDCPEKEDAILDAIGAAAPWREELAANQAAVQACRDRLVGQGIDLDDYDTPASVADMESIRRAMDVETWNVWGGSYGTRLGLHYARTHPDRVRALLIDSVYPPQVGGVERAVNMPGDAYDRLAAACAAEATCAARFGDLNALLDRAGARVDVDPEELTATFTLRGEEVTRDFVITGADVRAGLFGALYEQQYIPLLPTIIDQLANDQRAIVPLFITAGMPRLLDLSEGAYYAVDCADSWRLSNPGEARKALLAAEADGLLALGTSHSFCADWKVKPNPKSFNQPVTADVPTLVFGATLDPVTPYADSVHQASIMPDARFVSVPNGGHGGVGFNACTRDAGYGFLADPSAPLPACVASLQPNPFAT